MRVYYRLYKENEFIGIFYLYQIHYKYHRANLSLGLIPQKRGYTLSLDKIKTIIFKLFDLGFIRLAMEIEDTNEKSLKVARHLEQIGFVYEGKLRNNYGVNINSNVWSIIKKDFN